MYDDSWCPQLAHLTCKNINDCKKTYSCWEKSINGKYINGLPMHAERAHYDMCRKKCFISYVHILHVNSLESIYTYVWTLKTFPGILLFKFHDIEGIYYMSSCVSWHFITRLCKCKEHPLMEKYSLVERCIAIPYDNIEGQYVVTGNHPVYHFSCSCLSKILLRRVLIHIYVFISPYELRQT